MATLGAAAQRLLDREAELDDVGSAVDTALGGAGMMLVLEGGAGIGKTRLLGTALELASDRGMRCLSAVGGEPERELPFGVVRQLFEAAIADAGEAERARLLEGAAALAAPAVDPRADPTEAPATFATLHGLYWLTATLAAETPLVLGVDDAHWADDPSLRYMSYLARRLEGLPVLIAVSIRSGDTASERDLVADLVAQPNVEVLRPRPLSSEAVATLITEGLGERPTTSFAEACLRATGGNPFLARELVLDLHERGVAPVDASAIDVAQVAPDGVARSVLRRIELLPDGAAQLAGAIAVLGESANLATAAGVAGIDPDRAGTLLDALAGAGFIEGGTPLRFVHPLVRSAVTGSLGTEELNSAHRRAAAALVDWGASGDRAAAHLLAARANGEEWVVQTLTEAARSANASGAPDVAATYLTRAMAEPPPKAIRRDVLHELGIAELSTNDPAAIEHLQQAFAACESPQERGRAALALGQALSAFGRYTDAVPVYEHGIADLGDVDEQLRLELEAELIGTAAFDESTRDLGLEWTEKVRAVPEPDSRGACKLLASLAREEMAMVGDRQRAIELAERSLRGGFLMTEEPLVSFPWAGFVLMIAGELKRAVEVYDEALARTRARGAVLSAAQLSAARTLSVHNLGNLDEAAADGLEALEAAEAYEAPVIASYATAFVSGTLVARGELAEAEEAIGKVQRLAAAPEDFSGVHMLRSRARLRFSQGRIDEAAADFREVGARLDGFHVNNPGIAPWRGELAVAEHRLGNTREAARLAAEQLEPARKWGSPWLLAQSLRYMGVVEGGETGQELLREAVEVAARGDARLEQARALVELGALLRRSGSRKDSRGPLREGLDLALVCGARPLAERAHEELVASGAQPRRLRETGPDALTPSERRVAGMAAEGMTNRAIAQALFVSEKTVETHMRAVFRKLDIGSRSQLPERLEPTAAA